MKRTNLFAGASIAAGLVIGSLALAAAQDAKPAAGQDQPPLPPGWTQQDMQNMTKAGTPGKNHEFLTKCAGTWEGKTTMWMYPGAEPMESTATSTVTPIMDGRFIKVEWKGEMPGMGQYQGLGIYGYDNVTQQFVAASVDNMGTPIARGEGELSPDGKQLTWEYTYSCPITHKQTTMREVQKYPSPDEMTLEMHGTEPKSGKEFKMMVIELKRKGSSGPTGAR